MRKDEEQGAEGSNKASKQCPTPQYLSKASRASAGMVVRFKIQILHSSKASPQSSWEVKIRSSEHNQHQTQHSCNPTATRQDPGQATSQFVGQVLDQRSSQPATSIAVMELQTGTHRTQPGQHLKAWAWAEIEPMGRGCGWKAQARLIRVIKTF